MHTHYRFISCVLILVRVLTESVCSDNSKTNQHYLRIYILIKLFQGFKKSASDRWEFRHEKFQKGRRHLLAEIIRRKCEPSIFPSFLKASEKCPPAIENDLLEENKVLQRKNAELLSQIKHYKALEAELLNCLSRYVR